MDPKATINRRALLYRFLFVAVLALTAYFLFFGSGQDKQSPEITTTTEPVITVANTKAMFDQSAKIVFPDITERRAIEIVQVDKEMFFSDYLESDLISIYRVIYSDGSTGYEMSLSAGKNLDDYYFELLNKLQNTGWYNLFASRALLAAVIESEKGKTRLKITASKNPDGITEVYAQSITLK